VRQNPFPSPKGLWLFFGTSFHVAWLTHDGTTLLKGKTICTTKMGLPMYDTRKECGYTYNDHGRS